MVKRWEKQNQKEWISGDEHTRRWLQWCEGRVDETINNCIEILEALRLSYDKYHERQALANAIRHLEMFEGGEDVDV